MAMSLDGSCAGSRQGVYTAYSWTDWSVQLQGPGEQAQPRSGTGGCGTCTLTSKERNALTNSYSK